MRAQEYLSLPPKSLACLINRHSSGWRHADVCPIWHHFHHVRLLFFALHLPRHDIRFQSLVEVQQADGRIDDGHQDENDGQNGERGERFADGTVCIGSVGILVHPDQFEEEVRHASKVQDLKAGVSVFKGFL